MGPRTSDDEERRYDHDRQKPRSQVAWSARDRQKVMRESRVASNLKGYR